MGSPCSDLYEFGPYRLNVNRRVLTRDNQPVALAPKAFDLLLLMVRSPDRAFSKQELMASLWSDTFVEEANLSFQISTLRKALGEPAGRWIETVPRHGYRFSAAVTVIPPVQPLPATPASTAAPALPPTRRPSRWSLATLTISMLGLATYAALFRGAAGPVRGTRDAITTPLTAYEGAENVPSLSSDGSQVAFSWNGPKQDNYDIYVKLVGPGEAYRLTTDFARDDKPAYSPDGQRIAFLRFAGEASAGKELAGGVFVVPALGGAERLVATIAVNQTIVWLRPVSDLAWSPDGKWLAVGGRALPTEPRGIWLLEVDGQQRRRLTTAPEQGLSMGDASPAFSADGRRIAFVRQTEQLDTVICALPLTADLKPAGMPVKVASDEPRTILGLAWTPDEHHLLFSSAGTLGYAWLHRIALAPAASNPIGLPELLPFGEQATAISVARTGRLVYSAQSRDTSFWRLNLAQPTAVAENADLVPSTFDEHTPDYSPDGRQIAFASTRTGTEEIWIATVDGTNLRQVTSSGGAQCANPQWSPDGQTLLFNSRRQGSSDLYLLRPSDGELRRLTSDPLDELEARWSRDGQWIYFASNQTGHFEVWKMRAGGGPPIRVTRGGGVAATESPDGKFLYYGKHAASPSAIWRVPTAGGEETLVADGLSYSSNFAVGDRGLYFVAVGDASHKTSIDFFEFSTGRRTTLATIGKPWWFGVALSRDKQSLLYSVIESAGSNLMLVDRMP